MFCFVCSTIDGVIVFKTVDWQIVCEMNQHKYQNEYFILFYIITCIQLLSLNDSVHPFYVQDKKDDNKERYKSQKRKDLQTKINRRQQGLNGNTTSIYNNSDCPLLMTVIEIKRYGMVNECSVHQISMKWMQVINGHLMMRKLITYKSVNIDPNMKRFKQYKLVQSQ